MSIETAIYTRLQAVSAVTALISTRAYPNVVPQKPTLPFVVYEREDTERISAMGGDVGVVRTDFRIDCYATTYAGVKAVSTAVIGALQRFSGTSDSIVILDIFVADESDAYIEAPDYHVIELTFTIHHRE